MKNTNLVLGFMLIMLLALSTGLMAGTYSGGTGADSANAYVIADKDDLLELCTTSGDWGAYFKQTADIVFLDADFESGGAFYNSGAGFSPIGNQTTKFTGHYNGNGKIIDHLYISRSGTDRIGLFGYTNGATISNLGVTNVDITGNQQYVGGLVGMNYLSTVSNSYSTGSVTGSSTVGGLVGRNYSSTVSNSYSTGSVNGNSSVGGLVGYNQNSSTVSNSYSTGSVSGSSNVGGLVGWNDSSVNNSFWDTQTSNQSSSAGATGKTTAEMKTESTFTDAGWDFEIETTNGTNDYWDIDGTNSINNGYPFLSWQNGEDVSLPVELTSFTADNTRAGEITLHWVTESEIENLGFILERRQVAGGSSQAEWTEIASYITDESLRGQGSVTYQTVYTYTDKTVEAGQRYDYRLADVSYAGEKVYHALYVLGVAVTEIPEEFALFPAYPNPFNPKTVISYQLPVSSDVKLTIYDVSGRRVKQLVDGTIEPGFNTVEWNAKNIPSGVYFCKLAIGDYTATQKLILLK